MENLDCKTLKNRWLILLVVVMMTFMACLDGSIINVALPEMSKKLSADMSSIQWIVTIYLITISSAILIFGRLGDIVGKTKIFKFGICIFTFGSLMCGISNSLTMLLVSRVIQAIGASGTMSNSFGIITQVFPRNKRGRAIGIQSTFVAFGTMVGPALGGFIISSLKWNYIFLINIPIGIVTFILAIKMFPTAYEKNNEKLDYKGAFLFALAIISLFSSLIFGQKIGYKEAEIILGLIISIISMVLFIRVELNQKMPMLQLKLFKNTLFTVSVFCGFISAIATSCLIIIQPFYLQDVLKLSPAITGLFMMVAPIVLALVSPISGYLSDKIGSEFLTLLGLAFTSLGLILMATLNENSNLNVLVIFVIILSVGNGLFQSPNSSLVMSSVPNNKLGIAGSMNSLVRNIGLVLGISLSLGILYRGMSQKIGFRVFNYVDGRNDVFIFGMKYVYVYSSVICLIGVVLTAFRLHQKYTEKEEIVRILNGNRTR